MDDLESPINFKKRSRAADVHHTKARAVRLNFDTTLTPDEIISRQFDSKEKESIFFPSLHGTVEQERRRAWEEAQPKPGKEIILAPQPVNRYVPLELTIAQQIQAPGTSIVTFTPPAPPRPDPKPGKKAKVPPPPAPIVTTQQQLNLQERATDRRNILTKFDNEWGLASDTPIVSTAPTPSTRTPRSRPGSAKADDFLRTGMSDKDKTPVKVVKPWRLSENLRTIAGSFKAVMRKDGTISAQALTEALAEFSFLDIVAIDDLYNKLDIHRDNKVLVSLILKSFDDIINQKGEHRNRIRRACFEILHLDGKGYIHKAHLDKIKHLQKLGVTNSSQATCLMVKVMTDVFQEVLKQEEEDFLDGGGGGKKKKKKKVPALPSNRKSHIPLNKMRIAHISYPVFCKYFDESKEVAAAFLPCWLPEFLADGHLQHTVVMARIEEVEIARKAKEAADAAEAAAAAAAEAAELDA